MNAYKIILFGLSLILHQFCFTQQVKNNFISINIPTVEQEATSIWRTINDIDFLEQQGYKINLPEDEFIQSLITKSKNGAFGNEDFSEIYNLLESNIYAKSNYELALKNVLDQEELINKLIYQLKNSKNDWNWDFKIFDKYNIVFTLYGTGGSYDPDLGTITLLTTIEGDFMNYSNPTNTIIHEITHMGIEQSIVQKYNLPHGSKERIVDLVVLILFGEILPEYKIQNMGDTKIDKYLKNRTDLVDLESTVKEIVKKK